MSDEQKRKLPIEEDFKGWPHRAVVAFAARCARRVQPVFQASWPDASEEHVEAVERAICTAEGYAADQLAADVSIGDVGVRADEAALRAGDHEGAMRAAQAAAHAAYVANVAIDKRTRAVVAAGGAVGTVLASVYAVGLSPSCEGSTSQVMQQISDDFNQLRKAVEDGVVTADTPVPPEFFGPLWPEGEPEGWPKVVKPETGKVTATGNDPKASTGASGSGLSVSSGSGVPTLVKPDDPKDRQNSEGIELLVELDVPEDVSDEQLIEAAKKLAAEADAYHRALGGHGLKIDDIEAYSEAGVPEGVTP